MKNNLKEIDELLQLINTTVDKDEIKKYRNRINEFFTAEINRRKYFKSDDEFVDFLNKTFQL